MQPFQTFEMIIDLNSFESEKAIDETLAVAAVDLELANARIVSPVRLEAKAVKTSAFLAITGKMTGSIEIDCDRCLEPVQRPLDIGLDLEFVPDQQLAGAANLELHPDDKKRDAISGSEINIADIAREQLLLDIPQQFFCKDDCRGLCENCGANLNLKDCDCENDEIDPRWAALKNLT